MAKAEKIGIPSAKLSFCPSSKGKSTTLQLRGVLMEAGKERIGRDEDIDPERAHLNEYISQYGFTSGQEVYDYCKERSEEVSAQRIAAGQKKLRKDYIPMCATIFKPHSKFMRTLTEEQQRKFLHDVVDQFGEMVGKDKIVMAALHFDEQVPHVHIFWEPVEKAEGEPDRFCAKEQHNAKFLGRLNREVAPALRKKGWNLADSFDWMTATKEQQEERKKLIEEGKIVSGLSSVEYKARMEEQRETLEQRIAELLPKFEELEQAVSDLTEEKEQQTEKNRNLAKQYKTELVPKYNNLVRKYNSLLKDIDELEGILQELSVQVQSTNDDPAVELALLKEHLRESEDGREQLYQFQLKQMERNKLVSETIKKNSRKQQRGRDWDEPNR